MHFVDGHCDVVYRNLIRRNQTLGIGRRELHEGVVERLRRLAPSTLDQIEIAEGAELAIAHFDVDTVLVHVFETFDRIVIPGPSDGMAYSFEAAWHRVHALADSDAATDRLDGGVVVVVELARQVGLDRVMGDPDV